MCAMSQKDPISEPKWRRKSRCETTTCRPHIGVADALQKRCGASPDPAAQKEGALRSAPLTGRQIGILRNRGFISDIR
jgi:hypothetical protein